MVEQLVRDSKTLTMWIVLLAALSLAAAALTGCGSGRPDAVEEAAKVVEPVMEEPVAAEPVAEEPVVEEPVAEVEAPAVDVAEAVEPSIETEALRQAPAGLIVGLDGAEYPAYAEELIVEVKRALTDIELYRGVLDGVLDDATMAAIGRFQQMNELHPSGVPSPQTRELLTTRHTKGSQDPASSSG